jgi:RNA polymerase sigma factor (TIGR02999 family)
MGATDDVTELLAEWSGGNREALDRLMPVVYDELRRLARRSMRSEVSGHTLQTTALVNEAYLRLVRQDRMQCENRAHFFAIAARLMRRILVDHAREKQREKRGAGAQKVALDEDFAIGTGQDRDLIALDDALKVLAEADERKSRVVEMRFFGGLSVEEIGTVLGISPVTVMRDWKFAKAWLYRELSAGQRGGPMPS